MNCSNRGSLVNHCKNCQKTSTKVSVEILAWVGGTTMSKSCSLFLLNVRDLAWDAHVTRRACVKSYSLSYFYANFKKVAWSTRVKGHDCVKAALLGLYKHPFSICVRSCVRMLRSFRLGF